MNEPMRRHPSNVKLLIFLCSSFILISGLLFTSSPRPAMASDPAQAATATVAGTGTATVASTGTAAAVTAAPTSAATSTTIATLSAPAVVGSPTALVPVTGADQTPPSAQSGIILRIALGLMGLFLIALGFRSYRLGKR